MPVILTNSSSLLTNNSGYRVDILNNTSSVSIGAVTLTMNVPNGFQTTNVISGLGITDTVLFNQSGSQLKIVWFTLSPWNVNPNSAIMHIYAKGLVTGSLTLDSSKDWYNELANNSASIYTNFALKTTSLLNAPPILPE